MADELPSLSLSPEAAAALRAFALAQGIAVDTSGADDEAAGDPGDLISAVRDHFDVKDRDEIFPVEHKDEGYDEASPDAGLRCIRFELKGVKRSLGQTLSSTGLTIWRAAEHLCDFIFRNPERFHNRSVVELGCGLGMVSILLHKMAVAATIVATDGDADTMELLRNNLATTGSADGVDARKLYWGDESDTAALLVAYPARFDVVIASDVIYEDEQVLPLIDAVVALLAHPEHLPVVPAREIPSAQARSPQPARSIVRVAASLAATSAADVAATVRPPTVAAAAASAPSSPMYVRVRPPSEFLLAFARRNVPIDRVLTAAEAAGLAVEILSPGLHGVEPVYSFRWKVPMKRPSPPSPLMTEMARRYT